MADGASLPMGDWLRALHLEQYAENFERNELWRVSDCQHLSDEALTRLGILLPGHRRRILSGLLKAFTEALPVMDAPKLPPRRPVPMKRNIFRAGAAAAASSTEQEAGSDSVTEASPPRQQLETAPTPPYNLKSFILFLFLILAFKGVGGVIAFLKQSSIFTD